jgi:hypothetical protein
MVMPMRIRYAVARGEGEMTEERRTDAVRTREDAERMPTLSEFMDHLAESSANRESQYMRILGPSSDSGWLLTGNNPHDSAKHHVRKHHDAGDGFYFIAKYDKNDPNLRTPETARPMSRNRDPKPVWHRQKPWQSNFPLPDDLWDGPKKEGQHTPSRTKDEIKAEMVHRLRKEVMKGPTTGESSSVTLLRACFEAEGR